MISRIQNHGFPGFGRTGFGRNEIYPDIRQWLKSRVPNDPQEWLYLVGNHLFWSINHFEPYPYHDILISLIT